MVSVHWDGQYHFQYEYTDQHPSLTAKRLPWYQGLDPIPMWMMIKEPSKPGFDSGLSDMVNILPVLFLLLLLL